MENVSTVKMMATAQITETKSVEVMESAFEDKFFMITLDVEVGCVVYCPVFGCESSPNKS